MSDLKVSVIFDAKNGKFKSAVNSNIQSVGKLGNRTQQTAAQTRQFNQSLQHANNELVTTNRLTRAVSRSIATLGVGFVGGLLLKDLSDTTRSFQVLRSTLITATGSEDAAADAFDRLQKFAAKTPFSVEQSIQAFIKLKNLGLDPTEEALSSYGNTASAMGRDLDQFIEAVADASVSEFERLKEFGIKAKNQGDTIAFTFRKMTKVVANNATAIEGYLQGLGNNEFAGSMDRQAATYDGAISNMGDSWDKFLLKVSDSGAGDLMEDSVRGLTSNIDSLGENTDTVIDIFQIGLVVALGHVSQAVLNKTAVTAKDIIATRASAVAEKSLAQAEVVLAESAARRAVQEQAAAKRMLSNVTTTQMRSKATTNLARANGQVIATEKALATTRNTLASATKKLSVASKGLSIMSGLVGGLPGLLTMAAFATYSFATSQEEASKTSSKFENHLDITIEKLQELTKAQLDLELFNLDKDDQISKDIKKLAVLRARIEYVQVQAARGFTVKEDEGTVLQRDADIDTLELKLEKVRKLKELMRTILAEKDEPDNSGKTTKSTGTEQGKDALKLFTQQQAAMRQQIALLGETTELAKAEYAVTQGKYKDLLPAQKESITNLAREMDLKKSALNSDKQASTLAKQLSDASNSYAASLQKKIELTGESSEVARLAFELEHGSLKGITEELEKHLMLMAEKADRAQEDADAQLPFWEQMQEHISTTTQDFDAMWGNSFNSFAQGIGDAVGTAIVEGQNFGDAMKNIARSAIKEVISGLIQIGIKKLALAVIEKTIATTGATLATATAATTGTAIAVSMAPAAAMASLASFGGNSVPAMAGIGATFALSEGLALAGMAHDGIDNVPKEGTWLLDKGERVVDSRTNADLKQALKQESFSRSGDEIQINYSPQISAVDSRGVAELLEDQQEAIYDLVRRAKEDRGEEF